MSPILDKAALGIATCLLAGCLATNPLQSPDRTSASSAAPAGTTGPGELAQKTARDKPDETKPFDASAAALDLTKTDGAACAAVSDGGLVGNLASASRIAVTFAAVYAANDVSSGKFQAQLEEIRPMFKALSRNVLWLPVEAETTIGDAFFKLNKYQPAPPPKGATNRKIVREIETVFSRMEAYARNDLKSPLNYKLSFVTRGPDASMHMLPGGHLIVPDTVITLLAQERDEVRRDEIIHYMVAHEMSHALRRHNTKMVQVNLVDGILVADRIKTLLNQKADSMRLISGPESLGQMINFSANTVGSLVGGVCATQRWFNELEQRQELEADVCGAKLLHASVQAPGGRAIDPVRAAESYERLKERIGSTGKTASAPAAGNNLLESCFQSASHPAVESRQANLERYWVTLNPDYRRSPHEDDKGRRQKDKEREPRGKTVGKPAGKPGN